MIGAGVIARLAMSRAGLAAAVVAAAVAGWFYVQDLRSDLAAERVRVEAITDQRDDAREAAARAVERAREAQARERATRDQLDARLDAVRRSADACLDQPLPEGLFE